jgi:uncharacterized protein YndB with AHSA1/START domain
MHTSRSIQIDQPPAEVFAYLTDISRHPEWAGNPLTIDRTDAGPVRVGYRWQSTGHRLGTHTDQVVVTEHQPDSRFSYESTGDAGWWLTSFTLAPAGEGTVLSREMRSRRLTWFTRLLAPMILISNGPELNRNLRRIKAAIEGHPAARLT